jgi:Domain of unknown function (DUF6431)
MQMLYPFAGSIQQYIECVRGSGESERCRPTSCPLCRSRETMIGHGFYSRTVVDVELECSIRVRRYLCGECRRTVSLLPEFVLPYMRFTIEVIGLFLKARLSEGQTLKAAAEKAHQAEMSYQRGQDWVRRFRRQAESVSAALSGLVQPIVTSDFISKALGMLEKTGWINAHRFLFQQLRAHLLGWPGFLAPSGIAIRIARAIAAAGAPPHSTCMDSESPQA